VPGGVRGARTNIPAEGTSSVDGASDAGAAIEGASDAPEDPLQRFRCGTITGAFCDLTTEICELQHQSMGPPAEGCDPIPAQPRIHTRRRLLVRVARLI
jgi:hypothetical protein